MRELNRRESLDLIKRLEDVEQHPLMEQEQRELAEIGSLDLCVTQIRELPDSIGTLVNLQELSLSWTQISVLPDSIVKLVNLQELDLSRTQISELPDWIGKLVNLQRLYLSGTPISVLPDSIGKLVNLQWLDLSGTQIRELPNSIGKLDNLQWLYLSGTQIRELPNSIGKLDNLQRLYLSGTQIRELPDWIGKLDNLQWLYLSVTQIRELPNSIGKLVNLQRLYLRGTQISTLPDSIGELVNLERLDLSETPISALPDSIDKLDKLKKVDLANCHLHHIPTSVIQGWIAREIPFTSVESNSLYWWGGESFINLYGTTLATQPISLFFQPPELIQAYCDAPKIRISDAKVIFLGDGDAGKTHTIKRILNHGEHLDKAPDVTDGIDIHTFATEYRNETMNIRFWDFGGQEIMHSMHRCFLTGRCLYVVVIANRDNSQTLTQKAEYWLRNIDSFAHRSPVLLVVNKIDGNPNTAINAEGWQEQYNLIGQPIEYNARGTGANIEHEAEEFQHLTEVICREAHALDSVGMDFPEAWYAIREELVSRGKKDYYVSKEDYSKICRRHGEHNTDIQKWLLEWFNDMGICFSYHMDKSTGQELEKYQILNPEWLTNAIYIIVNVGKLEADNGKLHKNTILRMLKDRTIKPENKALDSFVAYTEEEVESILNIMRKFHLSLRYKKKEGFEFIAGICGEKKPVGFDACRYPKTLCYQFEYVYLPENVVHQLMLRCGAFEQVYRRGFRLDVAYEQLSAVVDMGTSNTQLTITIHYGESVTPLNFINWLKGNLAEINQSMGFAPKEFVLAEQNGKHAKIPLLYVIEHQADDSTWLRHPAIEDGSTLKFKTADLMGMVCTVKMTEVAQYLANQVDAKENRTFEERMVQCMEILITQTQKIALATGHSDRTLSKIQQNQLTAIEQQKLCREVMECLRQEQDAQCQALLHQMESAGQDSALDVLSNALGNGSNFFSVAESVLKPFLPKLLQTAAFATLPPPVVAVLKIWGGIAS